MTESNDRITVRNPNTGRDGARILRRIYEPVRGAILQAIGEAGELAFRDLRAEVARLTPSGLWEKSSAGMVYDDGKARSRSAGADRADTAVESAAAPPDPAELLIEAVDGFGAMPSL